MIRFDRAVCRDLDAALQREWLETNGLGGFASSTIAGLNTRRYHGLLIAATRPPVGRFVLLSKIEETVIVGERRVDLSANRYPGVIHPQGHRYLTEFRLDPFPVFVYEVDGAEIRKSVFMVHGENTTVIEYEIRGGDCRLELRPLIAFRDYHSTTHRNDALNRRVDQADGVATVAPYSGLPPLHFAHNADAIETRGGWYDNFEYSQEQSRGLDYREDLFNPLVLRSSSGAVIVIASTERRSVSDAAALRESELERRARVHAASPRPEPLVKALSSAAGQYIVNRGSLKTVIAGYPWFSDWGRDTMISLPGLTLVTGRFDIARQILVAFAKSMDRGMLPNVFPDAGETPEYNTVDATLWFFEAVRSLLSHTRDYDFVREHLYESLRQAIDWHVRGTRYRIRVDIDGLLSAGEPGVQLTWMDAKVGDWVVTPRHGKPVEIQALWYNSLRVMQSLAESFGDSGMESTCEDMACQASASFRSQFWNESAGCLYDVVSDSGKDASIRPNQILAVSLTYSMLAQDKARRVVDVVQRDLFTPLGLRSLAPGDPQYRPRYEGGVRERDSAYHQGTVWPWLMGPFLTAYLKVHERSTEARAQASEWLRAFEEHLSVAGLGHVSEIADGAAPHEPRGCVAQAWSVAELLRAAVEDVYATG